MSGLILPATVVADPAWTPSLGATWKTRFTDKARPQKQYRTLSLEEIKVMKPETASQAHLWLWVLNQHVDWGYEVARAWGFEPQQMITWKKPGLGNGRFQCNTESVLVCRKGSRHGNPFGPSGGTGFDWPRGRHSEKPDHFYRLVEQVSPGPYLEMFARRRRPGWMAHGDEIDADQPLFAAAQAAKDQPHADQ
jgi:N6-adenosine-specific RNA methylase IME4